MTRVSTLPRIPTTDNGATECMLLDLLLQARRRAPAAIAVADASREVTYRQLTLLAWALRDVTRRQTRGERVGIMLPASTIFPAALFGVLWAQRIAVPLNFLLNPEELAGVVEALERSAEAST